MIQNSQLSFEVLQDYLRNPVIKLALLLPLWFFLHHLCAGIRHVLLDLQIGLVLAQARTSSKLVLAAGFLLTALIGWQLW